jgi:pSer/pThr/pTyr-binding forkhead associated (FHA) protein
VVQLQFLNGAKAGTRWVACRLPFTLGRSAQDDLRIEDDGVWDRHARIELRDRQWAVLVASEQARTSVNGQPIQEAILRNGDILQIGSVQLQFGFSPAAHRGLRIREVLTWIGIALMALVEVTLVYLLGR